MPPSSADADRRPCRSRRRPRSAPPRSWTRPLPRGGLAVTLSDGTRRGGGLGGQLHRAASRRPRARRPSARRPPAHPRRRGACQPSRRQAWASGTDGGRLIDGAGTTDAPIWTLGALRRGELWESTAVPRSASRPARPRRCSTWWPRFPGASRTGGSSAVTTRSPGRATRWACRCRPRPRRRPRSTPASSASCGSSPAATSSSARRRSSTPTSPWRTPPWPCSARGRSRV